jgi:hypothetical protein
MMGFEAKVLADLVYHKSDWLTDCLQLSQFIATTRAWGYRGHIHPEARGRNVLRIASGYRVRTVCRILEPESPRVKEEIVEAN